MDIKIVAVLVVLISSICVTNAKPMEAFRKYLIYSLHVKGFPFLAFPQWCVILKNSTNTKKVNR